MKKVSQAEPKKRTEMEGRKAGAKGGAPMTSMSLDTGRNSRPRSKVHQALAIATHKILKSYPTIRQVATAAAAVRMLQYTRVAVPVPPG